MAGYLDQYGAGEERREKIIKTLVISLVALVVLGGIGFFVFHNYRQERQVKRFFELLQAHDYQGAYALWVHNESDRRGYPFHFVPAGLGAAEQPPGRQQLPDFQKPLLRLRRHSDGGFRPRISKKSSGCSGTI